VYSRNLVNEEALTHWWGGGTVAPKQTNKQTKHCYMFGGIYTILRESLITHAEVTKSINWQHLLRLLLQSILFYPAHRTLYRYELSPQERQFQILLSVYTATNHITMFCAL
jgi:hypothetical protein